MNKKSEIRVEVMNLEALSPNPNNPKRHSDEQIRNLVNSLSQFGWMTPILVDGKGEIIAGEGRWQAAKRLAKEGKTIPKWPNPGKVPVINQGHLSETEKRAYLIADNKLGETGAYWDQGLLKTEVMDLSELAPDLLGSIGLSDDDLDSLTVSEDDLGQKTKSNKHPGLGNPVIQYNIVFDSEEHQRIWYGFLRWLKKTYLKSETVSDRLALFITEQVPNAEG